MVDGFRQVIAKMTLVGESYRFAIGEEQKNIPCWKTLVHHFLGMKGFGPGLVGW